MDTALRDTAAIEATQIIRALTLAIARTAKAISQVDGADVFSNGLNGAGSMLR